MLKLHEKEREVLTIQVIMDILEGLVPTERIITLAHYFDSFDVKHLSEILETSLDYITHELGTANEYIKNKCSEYELQNDCTLSELNEFIIYEAFMELFKQDRYLINSE